MVDKQVHILGVQEVFPQEPGTFASSTHIRIVAGPAPGEKRGDVEIWLGRLVDWTSDSSGRAQVPDDVTLLASGQRFLLINLSLPFLCVDILCVHLPSVWHNGVQGTIQDATDRQLAVLRVVVQAVDARRKQRPLILVGDLNIELGHICSLQRRL